MINKLFLLFILVSSLFISCNQEDIFIDNLQNSDYYLFASDTQLIKFSIHNATQEIIHDLPAPVTKIKYFRGNFFLLMPSINSIYVIEEKSLTIISKIDLKSINFTPTDICFPNATDAYICCSNSNFVSIIDLTSLKLSNIKIAVGKKAVSIDGKGNQVYVCCQDDDAVFVIDTRVNTVVDTINVSSNPTFVNFSDNNQLAFVVSSATEKTDAFFQSIDVNTREIVKQFKLGTSTTANIVPTGIASSKKNLYITSNEYLFRISIPNGNSTNNIAKTSYNSIGYNQRLEEFYLVKNDSNSSSIIIYDAIQNKRTATYFIENKIDAIIIK